MRQLFFHSEASIDKRLLSDISIDIKKRIDSEVKYINLGIDLSAYYSVERRQYFSTKILAEAIKRTEPYSGNVLLLVDVDLYVPVFTFLFGEAQLRGKHSIVSIFRLHEEFYSGVINYNLLLRRTLKEIYHELGHNFGLIHCKNWDCVMHSSTSIEEVDIKGDFYCRVCRSQIK